MLQTLKALLHRRYSPLNRIEISAKHIRHNYAYLSSLNPNIQVSPVIKSNAYGHGLVLVAKELEKLKAPFLCVDSLFEAYELLKAGIKTPILIMGYIHPESLRTKKLPFSFAVYDYELLVALDRFQPRAKVHLFIDTGMHREGIQIKDLDTFLQKIQSSNIELEGVMSHLGMSEKPDDSLTKKQVDMFQAAVQTIHSKGLQPKWTHIANSSGLLNQKLFKGKLGTVARTGIAFYGYDPDGNKNLKPLLLLKTQIVQIKSLNKGEKVGYDFTFTAPKNMKIAVLPIGYYDGVDRRLSNKGYVSIKGKFCKMLGRVSMNLTTVDVTDVPDAKVGTEVTVYSSNPKDLNSIQRAADLCGTIPHDILVHLASSTKRMLVNR